MKIALYKTAPRTPGDNLTRRLFVSMENEEERTAVELALPLTIKFGSARDKLLLCTNRDLKAIGVCRKISVNEKIKSGFGTVSFNAIQGFEINSLESFGRTKVLDWHLANSFEGISMQLAYPLELAKPSNGSHDKPPVPVSVPSPKPSPKVSLPDPARQIINQTKELNDMIRLGCYEVSVENNQIVIHERRRLV